MNDRFKFRFWDKKEKEYFTCGDIDHKSGIFKTYPYRTYNWCFEHKNIIAEQCTGLKDKNGQLIYEGDIVEVSEAYENGIYKIEFCQSDCEYNLYNSEGNFIYQLTKSMARYMEVIGNIHNNADLIKVGGK